MKKLIFGVFFSLLLIFPSTLFAAPAPKQAAAPAAAVKETATEKEYYGVKVLLVDPKAGLLGVLFTNDDNGEPEKLSFRVDPADVQVVNKQNRFLDFSEILVGETLDLYVIVGPDGKETIDQIITYDLHPAD